MAKIDRPTELQVEIGRRYVQSKFNHVRQLATDDPALKKWIHCFESGFPFWRFVWHCIDVSENMINGAIAECGYSCGQIGWEYAIEEWEYIESRYSAKDIEVADLSLFLTPLLEKSFGDELFFYQDSFETTDQFAPRKWLMRQLRQSELG